MLTPAAIFTVALLLQAAAPAAPPPSTDALAQAYHLFLQGQAAEEREDFPAAAARYREALEIFPDAAEVRAELAGVHAQRGQFADARREADRALSADPDNRSAHRLLGLLDASSIDRTAPDPANPLIASAISHLERSAGPGVRDPSVMLTLGDMYVRGAQYARAITILEEFLLDRPGYPQAVMLLVQAYRESGQPEMAESVVSAFRGNAAESSARRLRGIETLESQGEWGQAVSAWERLLEEQPGELAYRLRYAAALVNNNELERGRSALQAITRDEPEDVRGWYLLAQVEQRAGNTDAAEAAARRIGDVDAGDARGPLALAALRAHRDDHRGVVEVLTPRVSAPTERDLSTGMFTEMATMLSDAWVEMGDTRRGIRTLEAARKHVPSDPQLLFSLAASYDQNNQSDRAEGLFREIIAADPEHAPALNYLGYMLADGGRKLPEALGFIERAIAVAGENPSYLDSLGWAYFRMARYEEAIEPLERAAQGAPQVSVIQDHLGDAYLQVKRYGDAVAAFDRALAGDRDGIDERALTRKRDRARAASAGK
jgi:predicted Zn-dependent protease